MSDEVNDMLQSAGRVVVAELSRQFNLPMDFLTEVSHIALVEGATREALANDILCFSVTCRWLSVG